MARRWLVDDEADDGLTVIDMRCGKTVGVHL